MFQTRKISETSVHVLTYSSWYLCLYTFLCVLHRRLLGRGPVRTLMLHSCFETTIKACSWPRP